jgi:[ribosomal protein S5]-alanine N-acetyltransferase
MTPRLESARLLLCPLQLGDAAQVQILFPRWEIVRFLANKVPWPYPPDGAYTFYRQVALPAIERGEEWHWSLRLKTDPAQLIGTINLSKRGDENRGFWLGLPGRGKGLMSEACEPVTEFWFETLKFAVLRAPKAIVNSASQRISEKQGMRVVMTEERDYVSGRFLSEIWEITAEEWRARKRSASSAVG